MAVKEKALADLLRVATQALNSYYQKQEPPLTLPQLSIMRALKADGSSTQGKLITVTHIDRSTMATILKRMEISGYLTRHRRAEDERTIMVFLSDSGRRVLGRAEKAMALAEEMALEHVVKVHRIGFLAGLRALEAAKW